jgi:hypothetical protein
MFRQESNTPQGLQYLFSASRLRVGAALIKKYSSYCTKQKKFHVFFPKTVAWGPETTPQQVADASPLLVDFVNLLLF